MVSLLSIHCKEGRLLKGVSVFAAVDTSTGVLSNAKMIAETVKEVSPETLVSTRPSPSNHEKLHLLTVISLRDRWSSMVSARSHPRRSGSMTGASTLSFQPPKSKLLPFSTKRSDTAADKDRPRSGVSAYLLV